MRSLIIHTMITLLSVSKRELKFYLPWEEKRFEYNTDFFFYKLNFKRYAYGFYTNYVSNFCLIIIVYYALLITTIWKCIYLYYNFIFWWKENIRPDISVKNTTIKITCSISQIVIMLGNLIFFIGYFVSLNNLIFFDKWPNIFE